VEEPLDLELRTQFLSLDVTDEEVLGHLPEAALGGLGLGLLRIGEKLACLVARLFQLERRIAAELVSGLDRDLLAVVAGALT
jgi:hypothetical protein